MKVLHIAAGNLFGGIETLLVTMARERSLCPDLKPHFSVCFENRLSRELRATGVPVDYLGEVKVRNPLSIFRARAALDRLLKQEMIDVAICHAPWAQAIFGPVVRDHGTPLVFSAHGFVTGRHWLEVWARRTNPDLIICNSKAIQTNLNLLYSDIPSQLLHYPISNSAIASRREKQSNPVVIIQVSRMEKWKGHTLLLEALAKLKDLPNWVCWFVGGAQTDRETKYEDTLHRMAARLGLTAHVDFLGSRDDVPSLLAQADIFCQPNLSPEPFGIVFIEALQSGLPVISTRMGGAEEIINDSCGELLPPGEVTPLADALRVLVTNHEKRHHLGLAGPARAKALCDPASQLSKIRELLGSLT